MQEELESIRKAESLEAGTQAKEQIHNWHQVGIQK